MNKLTLACRMQKDNHRFYARAAVRGAAIAALLLGGASGAHAAVIDCSAAGTWCGTYNNATTTNQDTAAAQFSVSGSTLTVVLTNTSTFASGTYQNADVLSGLFFSLAGNPTLSGTSATASGLIYPPATTISGQTSVDNGWGWQYSSSGFSSTTLTTSARYGIAAAGFSSLSPSFGHSNFGSGTSRSLGGMGYGIVGTNFQSIGGNASPLADNAVTFAFSGLPTGMSIADISNVTFAYGTAPDGSTGGTTTTGQTATPVPEPTSLAVFAIGLLGLSVVSLQRRRH